MSFFVDFFSFQLWGTYSLICKFETSVSMKPWTDCWKHLNLWAIIERSWGVTMTRFLLPHLDFAHFWGSGKHSWWLTIETETDLNLTDKWTSGAATCKNVAKGSPQKCLHSLVQLVLLQIFILDEFEAKDFFPTAGWRSRLSVLRHC